MVAMPTYPRTVGMSDGTPKSYQDRLDSDGTLLQAEQMARLLRNPIVRGLFRLTGGSTAAVQEEAERVVAQMRGLVSSLDADAAVLGELGWCMHSNAMPDDYRGAARLARSGRTEEAEQLLVEAWNTPERLRTLTKRIITLYDPEDARRHLRWLALDEALSCHEAGFYRGAIGIVLPLIEGIVDDVTPDDRDTRFYRRGTADRLSDDETLAGHPLSLPVLSRIMGKSQSVTAATGELTRNGILHGKELDYGTRANSTKALVALIAAVEWAQPLARQRLEAEAAAREEAFAGNDGVDEDGRRLDRREFADVKNLLHTVATYQFGRRKHGRRYTDSVSELGLRESLGSDPRLHIHLDDEDDAFYSWFTTVSGWVFGIAGKAGEFPVWQFSDASPPTGGPRTDHRWASAVGDPSPPDW